MGLFESITKLINEHGSAEILNERIALAEDKYAALENKLAACELRAKNLEAENTELKEKLSQFEEYVCDHCGSPKIKRIGNRPDPTFEQLGVKQAIFLCEDCGKESAFTP